MRTALLGVVMAIPLTGCIQYVESASIAIDAQGRADIDLIALPVEPPRALALGSTPEEQRQIQENENARKASIDRAIIQRRECFSGNLTYDDQTQEVRIFVRGLTAAQVQTKRDCDPFLKEVVDYQINRSHGWFRDSITMKLTLKMPIVPGENSRQARIFHPSNLTVGFENAVAGRVTNESTAIDIDIQQTQDDQIEVNFSPNDSAVNEIFNLQNRARDCPGKQTCPYTHPYASSITLEFVSHKNNFGLGDLLAFFSILFGSGLAITIGSRILAVRTEQSPSPQ